MSLESVRVPREQDRRAGGGRGREQRLAEPSLQMTVGEGLPAPRPGLLDHDPGLRDRRGAGQRFGCLE